MLVSNVMALNIINALSGVDQPGGINSLWIEVCNYISQNAMVMYSWVAASTSVPPTPDPMVVVNATIDTSLGSTISLPGFDQCQDATSAMALLSGAMNATAATWMISFPTGFLVSPCFVIPAIVLTPSGANDQLTAMNQLCSQIISGIKLATPAMTGTHGIYVGAGAFTSIN